MTLSHISPALRSLAMKVSLLQHDPDNASVHSDKNIGAIRESLLAFGQDQPLVVQKQGMIVRKGNGRLIAMRQLGWEWCAAVVVDDNDATAIARAIADNRSGQLATWDYRALGRAVMAASEERDVSKLGWTPDEIGFVMAAAGLATPATPPPPTTPDGPGGADPGGPGRPGGRESSAIKMTADQRKSFDAAYRQLTREVGGAIPEGRAVELICAEWMQDPNRAR